MQLMLSTRSRRVARTADVPSGSPEIHRSKRQVSPADIRIALGGIVMDEPGKFPIRFCWQCDRSFPGPHLCQHRPRYEEEPKPPPLIQRNRSA